MKKWKAVLGIIAVFILGGVAGAFIALGCFHHSPHWGSPQATRMIVRRLTRELSLDQSQKAKVEAIITAAHDEMTREVQPRIEAIIARSQEEIKKALQPEQQAKFDALCNRWKERRSKWDSD